MCALRQPKMSGMLMNPSLASATGTRLDSSCKHIQQCRVSQDHMTQFAKGDEQDMIRNKYKYAVHKDELVLGVGKCWKKDQKIFKNEAYPRVVSNLGQWGDEINSHVNPVTGVKDLTQEARLIQAMYHNITNMRLRNSAIDAMQQGLPNDWQRVCLDIDNYNRVASPAVPDRFNFLMQHDNKMMFVDGLNHIHDFITVGYANTLGYAHAYSGDTMTSVMIGGLRTVLNGDFEIYCGDVIQWYWPFERECFLPNGERRAVCSMFEDPTQSNAAQHPGWRSQEDQLMRKTFHDRQYGQVGGKVKMVPLIKPYHRDDDNPRLYDWYRVFAVAISSARPHEAVDIRISRQAI